MKDEELRAREKNTWWYKRLQRYFREGDIFANNEIKANMFSAFLLFMLVIVLIISYVLTAVGVFDVPLQQMKALELIDLPIIAAAAGLNFYHKGQGTWLKFVLVGVIMFVTTTLCSSLSIFVTLIIPLPVIVSCRYYSRRFTILTSICSIICLAITEVIYARYGMLDLNLVSIPSGTQLLVTDGGLRGAALASSFSQQTYLLNLFRGSFLTRLLFFMLISFICVELAGRAHEIVVEQAEISRKTEAMNTELKTAMNIQEAVLPKVFPPFADHPELDIYASMDPAKEVGGDFYDYAMLDEDHLLLVIADVSGKGIPGALFMMVSKLLIKTHAGVDRTPARIAAEVNRILCEDNKAEMFVTAWIGVLELSTGIMTAVDAGHEYPMVKHGDGDYEIFKGKKSFVLAGMNDVNYREYTFSFNRGDRLFLFTDGVTEASNETNELFGMERLLETVNKHQEEAPKVLLASVTRALEVFVDGYEQSDDITMVGFYYHA